MNVPNGNGNGNGRMSTLLFNGLLLYLAALGAGMVVIQIQIAGLVSALPLSTDDRYRRHDAEADFRYRDQAISDLKDRMSAVEAGRIVSPPRR